ncbi:acyl-CoA dehydrogenase [Amycolatopsis coloradensis]|nr:acyl-CoA dehydrogenase [Amycolatopsis coloradensis]
MTADLTALFDDETTPLLRRLGQRARGAGADAAPDPVDTETRQQVWSALTGLGALSGLRAPAEPETFARLLDVADLMGAALYQSPFPDTVTAADLLGVSGKTVLRDGITEHGRTVALAPRAHGTDHPASPAPWQVSPDGTTVTAVRKFVGFAAEVDDLLVLGTANGRVLAGLVAVDQPGVRARRQDDVAAGDLYAVTLESAVVTDGVFDVDYPGVLARARVRHGAYLIGAARAAVRLTGAYLRSRNAFGAPLAKSTVLAHRLAGLAAEAEAVRALADTAAEQGADARAGARIALLAGEVVRRSAEEAVHLHGAFGMTDRCDAQLFYRRALVDGQWYGTATALRAELAAALARR